MTATRFENGLISMGMLGVLCFLAYMISVGLGYDTGLVAVSQSGFKSSGILYSGGNISLAVFFGICMLLFSLGMLMRAYRTYNRMLLFGFVVFLNMQVLFNIGFALFPLRGAFIAQGGMSTVHAIISSMVAVLVNVFAFLVGFGYYKQRECKRMGIICLLWATIITLINISNLLVISFKLELFGMSERILSFVLMGLILSISYTETFVSTRYNRIINGD